MPYEGESRERIAQARASYRPTITVQAAFGYAGPIAPFIDRKFDRALVGQVVISQPLFTSGLIGSQVRAAADQNTSDRITIEIARRTLVQNVVNAWNQILVARGNVALQREQIRAADVAFTGMRIEYKAGLRGTLDVLIAEETLRDAELSLLNAVHDQYVAEATLLRVIGRLDGPDLIPGLPQYDPARNLRRVELKGWTPLVSVAERLDGLGRPGAGQHAIDAPTAITAPAEIAAPVRSAPQGPLVRDVPTAPIPGAVSPAPQGDR